MIYPDEEKITYSYNLGGQLEKVHGYKSYGYRKDAAQPSVYALMRRKYQEATGPLIVHRLDRKDPFSLCDLSYLSVIPLNRIGRINEFTDRGSITLGCRRQEQEFYFYVADTCLPMTDCMMNSRKALLSMLSIRKATPFIMPSSISDSRIMQEHVRRYSIL